MAPAVAPEVAAAVAPALAHTVPPAVAPEILLRHEAEPPYREPWKTRPPAGTTPPGTACAPLSPVAMGSVA